MILLVGGAGQGKLTYALRKTGLKEEDVAQTLLQGETKPLLNDLHLCIRTLLQQKEDVLPHLALLLEKNPEIIILCDEIGSGVVPIAAFDREWREAVGRACLFLADRALRVERIFCGLPMILKEETQWKSF